MTDLRALRALSAEDAAHGYPVSLRGCVTFIDALGRLFVIQQGNSAVRVDVSTSLPQLRIGQQVEVTGITSPGDYHTVILGATVKVLDAAIQMPPAIPLSGLTKASEALDYALVEVHGVQRRRWFNSAGRVVIEVETGEGMVQATCFQPGQENAPQWLGQRVRMQGILRNVRDLRGRLLRSEVWLPEWGLVLPEGPPVAAVHGPLPLQTTVAGIRQLSGDEAARGIPVHLAGTVTFVTPQGHEFFLQDATGGIYVARVAADYWPALGDRVELDGHTVRGNFLTDVVPQRIGTLGRGELPTPVRAGLGDILAGRYRAVMVQVEGVVVTVQPSSVTTAAPMVRSVSLRVLAEGNPIPVSLPYPTGPLPEEWVGARVRIQGVCGSIFNQRRQFLGIQLFAPGERYVTVLEAAPGTAIPFRRVAELLQVHSGPEKMVRVEGVVTRPPVRDRGALYLQDETGGLLVTARGGEPVMAGDRVEAIGVPRRGDLGPILESASYRKTGSGAAIDPPVILPEEALRGDYDSQLVRIDGHLFNQGTGPGRQEIAFQAGSHAFSAELNPVDAARLIPAIRPGSLVRVTGICAVHTDAEGLPDSFRILLRSAADVKTLEESSWWTRGHLAVALSLTGLAAVSALGWIWLLRRRVRQQTILIEQKEQLYRSLVENAPDIIYTCGPDGNLTSVNLAAEQLTGFSRQELLGMNLAGLSTPECLTQVRRLCQEGAAPGDPPVQEIEFRTKDGSSLALECRLSLMYRDGRPVSVQGTLRDVSKLRRLQEQLAQSQKMEALGHLAGGVAHHFNNLLTTILGYCELLINRTPADSRDYQMLTLIRKSGQEAALITAQLLAFGRKQMRFPQALDLSAVLSEMEQVLRPLLGEEIQLFIQDDAPLERIVADAEQIKQVITSLVVNAREAMPKGGRVVIRAFSHQHAIGDRCGPSASAMVGNHVHLSVTDSGRGISKDLQKRIFEPFFTTKEVGHGTGLGLSSVEGIVSQSGGTVWVESGAGEGTTFTICLPALPSGEPPASLRDSPSPPV